MAVIEDDYGHWLSIVCRDAAVCKNKLPCNYKTTTRVPAKSFMATVILTNGHFKISCKGNHGGRAFIVDAKKTEDLGVCDTIW